MGYALRDGVSFCAATRRIVFLDLKQDLYFCLGAAAETAFAKLVAGDTLADADQQALERLKAKRLLIEVPGNGAPEACRPGIAAATDFGSHAESNAHRLHVFTALYDLSAASTELKVRPLWKIVRSLQGRKARRSADRGAAIAASVAMTFRSAGLVFGAYDRCLPRSVAMMRHLLRRGARPELVFGVQADPFVAHCWVQYDGIVLNDRHENTRNFTPILAI